MAARMSDPKFGAKAVIILDELGICKGVEIDGVRIPTTTHVSFAYGIDDIGRVTVEINLQGSPEFRTETNEDYAPLHP